jgi:hypothetical protein
MILKIGEPISSKMENKKIKTVIYQNMDMD